MSQNNPLEKFFRQPKFNLRLPSNGRWYQKDSLTLNADGTVQVFAMTAKDDLLFKRGEVFLEKQSTLELLHSCIPAIKKPELMPSIDIDACLLAIRKATYGDVLKVKVMVPVIQKEKEIDASITEILQNQGTEKDFDTDLTIEADDGSIMDVKIKPAPLEAILQGTKSIIAQSNAFKISENVELSDEAKIEKLNEAFNIVSRINVDFILESIESLKAENQIVTSKTSIKTFLQNCDAAYFNAIKEFVENQKESLSIKKVKVAATSEEIALGVPEVYEVEVKFDNSEFFV